MGELCETEKEKRDEKIFFIDTFTSEGKIYEFRQKNKNYY